MSCTHAYTSMYISNICLSIHLFVCLSLAASLLPVCLSVSRSIDLIISIYPCLCLSVYLSIISLSLCHSLYLSFPLSTAPAVSSSTSRSLSLCLSIHLLVCLSMLFRGAYALQVQSPRLLQGVNPFACSERLAVDEASCCPPNGPSRVLVLNPLIKIHPNYPEL